MAVASGLGDDPVDRRESEPRAFALGLGREEGLEGTIEGVGVHARPGVADPQAHVAAGRDAGGDGCVVEDDIGGVDDERPTSRHGVSSVHDEVHQDLLELA